MKLLLAQNPPRPGVLYRIEGRLSLYVRTERRPGIKRPQHLFVHVSRRMIYERWTSEVPQAAEMVVDESGRQQANEEQWLRLAAEYETRIVMGLLKKACELLPKARADELRDEYRATRALG